ncbi:putative methyltransferase [Azorhizobium caulinodans ORS 571]|uniref:Putative methyltransferase n=1 Tax=Azorhizobium caulinodans (strain ATCC 43989 / DSM 5975 / JCM 20966 / LMG 6465 / NBRC 14845 / NCIMB 13405 / ORS 571) TaxID=438753 RepID=A8HR88_AZOC5|nr:methyltransferase domain-containing protein [Azorhizobium caulinodans]BAF87141.1 putative methyltransferase [Azorhizobium caulinodans ORS 571]
MDWVTFWDGAHSIYVNDRHKMVHYQRITADIVSLIPDPSSRVMDYGCGEALGAPTLADNCAQLILADAAPTVRATLKDRLGGEPNISVLSPEETAELPPASLDLIIANSLLQYISKADLKALLAQWRGLLAPGGAVILADVIPPNVSAVQDAAALLTFGAREGFFFSALLGLARTAVSPYRKLRADLGLTTYEEGEMITLLRGAGYLPQRLPKNIGHNQRRMAFRAVL